MITEKNMELIQKFVKEISEGKINLIRNYSITSTLELTMEDCTPHFDWCPDGKVKIKNRKILTLYFEGNDIGLFYRATKFQFIKESILLTFGGALKDVSIINLIDVTPECQFNVGDLI